MSDNEDWRRERAERLHVGTDWVIRPASRPAPPTLDEPGDVLPMHVSVGPRPHAVSVSDGPTERIVTRPFERIPAAAPMAPRRALRAWPYVLGAIALLLAAVALWFAERGDRLKTGVASMTERSSSASIPLTSLPVVAQASTASPTVAASSSGCADALAAPSLSALIRRGTAFDGDTTRVAASATLSAVRHLRTDAATSTCHAVLDLQLVDHRPGAPTTMQMVSGPIDYLVEPGPDGTPHYRVVKARAILNRLATIPQVIAAVPVADAVATARVAPTATPIPVRVVTAWAATAPTPVGAAPTRVVAAPVPARPLVPVIERRVPATIAPQPVVERPVPVAVAPPLVVAPPPRIAVDVDEQTAASDEARSIYGEIARSGDQQAINAADEGRDIYMRRSRRCATPACAATAYRGWVDQLRSVVDQQRRYADQ